MGSRYCDHSIGDDFGMDPSMGYSLRKRSVEAGEEGG